MSVRSFPMPRWPNRGQGWCCWCGEAVEKPARTWHKDCLTDYRLHTWPDYQIAYVRERDGEACWDCKTPVEKWLGRGPTYRASWNSPDPVYVGPYFSLKRVSALELEHEVPLWSVAHLPAEERRPYFGPRNLRLRCPECHKAKSRREAAERAALKREAVQPDLLTHAVRREGGR